MRKLSIIIPAAGGGRLTRSLGPRSLVPVTARETVLARQLRVLGDAYPRAEVVLVLGHDAERVIRDADLRGVRLVENERHDETNVVRSIGMGLRAASGDSALVVYGDLVFNRAAVAGLGRYGSCVVAAACGDGSPGVTSEGRYAAHFDFGLPGKWAQIAYLSGPELESFRRFATDPGRAKFFGFEALNRVIDDGGRLRVVEPAGAAVVEVDTARDVADARELAARRTQ